MTDKLTVLFVGVHNAGRSHMAAGFMQHLCRRSDLSPLAGSAPADQINTVAVAAMAEECPYVPGKRYEDWKLDDPARVKGSGGRRT